MTTREKLKSILLKIGIFVIIISFVLNYDMLKIIAEEGQPKGFENYTVKSTEPAETTVNLYDFWRRTGANPDKKPQNPDIELGDYTELNKKHDFKFGSGMQDRLANKWTGDSTPRQKIVKNQIEENDYPRFNVGNLGLTIDETIGYLFDTTKGTSDFANSEVGTYKKVYKDVKGLFQVDEHTGNYYYDSLKNFASYNENENRFELYNSPAVKNKGGSKTGQFFPLNKPEQVFQNKNGIPRIGEDGKLKSKDIRCENDSLNHYMGLYMETSFIQPKDGKVTAGNPNGGAKNMVFEFFGDDDVWVFIDDVLVLDIGGIHDGCSGKIDFSTGEVKVRDKSTNIKDCFKAAGKDDTYINSHFNGEGKNKNTFKDDSHHTLKFFYLERGDVESNIKLSFNLKHVPENSITKVDHTGNNMIPGITYKWYEADENYNKGKLIKQITTDSNGNAYFRNSDDSPYKFTEGSRYILEEANVPDGYRSTGDIKLRVSDGLLIVDNHWSTGAYASFSDYILQKGDIKEFNNISGDQGDVISKEELSKGQIFVVPLFRKDKSSPIEDSSSWYPVYGTSMKGFKVEDGNSMSDIISAAQKNANIREDNSYIMHLNENGFFECVSRDLPGDAKKYYFTNSIDWRESEFVLALYYTEAKNIADATESNTKRLSMGSFSHEFSANLYIPNIKNLLRIKKLDTAGNLLSGAEFELHKNNNGTFQLYDKLTTSDSGAEKFPIGNKVLENGEYELREVKSPDGYELNKNPIKVIVNEQGVFADAGNEGDNIEVWAGVGELMQPMVRFASENVIDETLTYITATSMTSNDANKWNDGNEKIELYYGGTDKELEYGTVEQSGHIYLKANSGYIKAKIEQNYNIGDKEKKTNLQGKDISGIFTGSNTVVVKNSPEEEISFTPEVKKELDGRTLRENEFKFEIVRADNNLMVSSGKNDSNGNIVFEPLKYSSKDIGKTYDYKIYEVTGTDKDIEYDRSEIDMSVSIDNEKNVIVIFKKNGREVREPKFENIYNPKAQVNITAKKELEGKNLEENEFKFKLIEIKDGKEVLIEETYNNLEGDIIFSPIEYKKEDIGKHIYRVEEVTGNTLNMKYDKNTYYVEIIVSKENDGIKAEILGDNSIVFKNKYKDYSSNITAEKELIGKVLEDQEFEFILSEINEIDGLEKEISRTKNTSDGEIVFPKIDYTEDDIGEHKYTIREISGENTDIVYDTSEKIIIVEVYKDNSDGKIKSRIIYEDDMTFRNKYIGGGGEILPPIEENKVEVELSAKKILKGAELKGGQFEFELLNDKGELVSKAYNGSYGNIVFNSLKFYKEGVYKYFIREVQGKQENITYDSSQKPVYIEVKKNTDNRLIASVNYEDGNTFKNIYAPKPAEINIDAEVKLIGRDMKDKEFEFKIVDSEDKVLKEKENDNDGYIDFGKIMFTEEGEYIYTIDQIKRDDKSVIYDESKKKVVISVTKDSSGNLTAINKGEKKPIFVNRIIKESNDDNKEENLSIVKTGDKSILKLLSIFILSLCMLVYLKTKK